MELKFCYIIGMDKKSLRQSNPFLADPKKRERAFIDAAVTSSAVEGIRVRFKKTKNNGKEGVKAYRPSSKPAAISK